MLLFLLFQLVATPPLAITPAELPFVSGEVLTYDARVSLIGRVGEAVMRVERACRVGDRDALLLSFSVRGGAAFLRVEDDTRSWIDARTLATLRFEKRESSPLGDHAESVSITPELKSWQDSAGQIFAVADERPVDELSLLYYVRTLPLRTGDRDLGAGHFDARRNPITLRVAGRSTIEVPAGRFQVIDVVLRVRDPRRYRGTGEIRLQLSDDVRRIPVRIRTALPGSTAVTLELRSTGSADRGACDPGDSPDSVVR